MSEDPLLIDRTNDVLTLTINRPEKRNALRMDLLDEIGATCKRFYDDDSIKCAVITGASNKCFAAGGDLKELDAVRSPQQAEALSQRGRAALDLVRQFPAPVIAALNGLAYGGGAELAMACDMRVAVENAQIGFLQAELNVTTAWGGGIDLIAALGRQKALHLLLSAERVSASQAYKIGLIDFVCAKDQSLESGLAEFLAKYLARSSQVLRGFKSLTSAHRQALHMQLSTFEQEAFVTSWTHEDHWAAVENAFGTNDKK